MDRQDGRLPKVHQTACPFLHSVNMTSELEHWPIKVITALEQSCFPLPLAHTIHLFLLTLPTSLSFTLTLHLTLPLTLSHCMLSHPPTHSTSHPTPLTPTLLPNPSHTTTQSTSHPAPLTQPLTPPLTLPLILLHSFCPDSPSICTIRHTNKSIIRRVMSGLAGEVIIFIFLCEWRPVMGLITTTRCVIPGHKPPEIIQRTPNGADNS